MIKRIERRLANIFKTELKTVETDAGGLYSHVTQEILALRGELKTTALALKVHAEEVEARTKIHAEEVATKLHDAVAEDAKVILHFQQTARLGCSWCGQLSRTYRRDKVTGKITCADCQQKGRG